MARDEEVVDMLKFGLSYTTLLLFSQLVMP